MKAWFCATSAIEAPSNDINFLKELVKYKNNDKVLAEQAIHKFINHLWYLSEECAAFSIFDERISDEIRGKMAKKLLQTEILSQASEIHKTEQTEGEKRNKLLIKMDELEDVLGKNLSVDLLGIRSHIMFKRFHISKDFLKTDSTHWKAQESYKKGREIIASLKVVNDIAERGVKLMEEFDKRFSVDEEQKQFALKHQ